MGLIRRGIDYAHRLGSLGTRRQSPDALCRSPYPGPLFPRGGSAFFFASPFTGWSSLFSGVTHPYKQHVWVHACVNAIAQNISGVPLLFFTGSRKNKKLVESGPLVQVMESPNPMMSGSQLIDASYVFLGITGEAIHILDRQNITESPPRNLDLSPLPLPARPGRKLGLIKGWIYTGVRSESPYCPTRSCFPLLQPG